MIRRLFAWPYHIYLRLELKWIEDCIADEHDHQAQHPLIIRALQTDAAEIRWKLDGGSGRRVVSLLPRDRIGVRRA